LVSLSGVRIALQPELSQFDGGFRVAQVDDDAGGTGNDVDVAGLVGEGAVLFQSAVVEAALSGDFGEDDAFENVGRELPVLGLGGGRGGVRSAQRRGAGAFARR